MDDYTADDLQAALRPIASLISKSEKALQNLKSGTWQHAMLRDNLKALHCASALIHKGTRDMTDLTRDDLPEALEAITSMINKTEKAQTKFTPGTSQHTLLQNRLKALRIAVSLITKSLAR